MPKLAIPLTDIQVKNAKAKEKDYRLTDGGGLFLLVGTDGSRYWRMDYRLNDKRNTLAFGKYPDITLADARKKRSDARALLNDGKDPAQVKRLEKTTSSIASANTSGAT